MAASPRILHPIFAFCLAVSMVGVALITPTRALAATAAPLPIFMNPGQFVADTVSGAISKQLNSSLFSANGISQLMLSMAYSVFNIEDEKGNKISQGALETTGGAIAMLIEHKPASGVEYVADVFQHSKLAPTAYAQGLGFQSLSNILPIWKAFRDVAYVLYALIFVVVGFFIIFRQKLDGHTVATISSAIPNLIVSLILITFSYAIAGFVIDLMYLVIYLLIGIAGMILPNSFGTTFIQGGTPITLQEIALQKSIFTNGFFLVFGSNFTNGAVGNASAAVAAFTRSLFASGGFGNLAGMVLGGAANALVFCIFAVAMLFAVVRTFFALLKSYVSFIIAVILSPLQLLFGAVSGSHTFVEWFKGLIANLAPFPVVIGMIFLAMALNGYATDPSVGFRPTGSGPGGGATGGFQAPLISLGDSGSPDAVHAIQGLIGIGILMLMPEVIGLVGKVIKTHSILDEFGKNISANLKTGWEGGDLIPGFKQTHVGGAPKFIGKGVQMVGGFVGGSAAGGYAGWKYAGGKKASTLGRVGAAIGGGTLGGLAGTAAPIVYGPARSLGNKAIATAKRGANTVQVIQSMSTGLGGGKPASVKAAEVAHEEDAIPSGGDSTSGIDYQAEET